MMSSLSRGPLVFLVGAAALATAPFWLAPYYLSIATLTVIHIGLAAAWNISGGIAGQFSLGHSLFVALGGVFVAALVVKADLNPWLAILLGALAAGVLAFLISMLSFRRKLPHMSFALITLALAEVGLLLVLSTDQLGAASGLVWPRGDGVGEMQFTQEGFFWLGCAVMIGACVVSWLILRSKIGYYLRAIRDDEDAAEALGIQLVRYKTVAMVVSAMLTAVVASVFARYQTFVDPNELASPVLSISVILYVVVGGLGTLRGPILGAGVLYPAGEILRGDFGQIPGLHHLLFGVVIVFVVLQAPRGMAGFSLPSMVDRMARGRQTDTPTRASHEAESTSDLNSSRVPPRIEKVAGGNK